MDKYQMRQAWHKATSDLPWGVQHTFLDVLNLVKEGKKTDLVYGADYTDKGACLVNAAGNLLTTGGGHGIPSQHFGAVVSMFDRINGMLAKEGVNTTSYVSPLAAEILVQWFGNIKDQPTPEQLDAAKNEAFADNVPYVEPDDETMQAAFIEMLENPARVGTPFDEVKEDCNIEFVESVESVEAYADHEVPD